MYDSVYFVCLVLSQVICLSAVTVIIKAIRIVIILKEKVEEIIDRRRSDKKGREETLPDLWG